MRDTKSSVSQMAPLVGFRLQWRWRRAGARYAREAGPVRIPPVRARACTLVRIRAHWRDEPIADGSSVASARTRGRDLDSELSDLEWDCSDLCRVFRVLCNSAGDLCW